MNRLLTICLLILAFSCVQAAEDESIEASLPDLITAESSNTESENGVSVALPEDSATQDENSEATLPVVTTAETGTTDQDSGSPVEITADSVVHDESDGTLTYSGNVIIKHVKLNMTSDNLLIKEKPDGGHMAHATGAPMRFKQVTEAGKVITGHARKGDYDIDKEKLVLTGNAMVIQDGDSISHDRIEVDMRKGIASAGGGKSSSPSRVHTVIKSKAPKE